MLHSNFPELATVRLTPDEIGALQQHPIAARLLPPMQPEERDALAQSLRDHGLRHPIVLLDGEVLSGWERLAACKMAHVDPVFVSVPDGSDPIKLLEIEDLERRHLTTGQKAAIAALLVTTTHGGDRRSDHARNSVVETVESAAKKCGVSMDSVRVATKLLNEDETLFHEVHGGRMSLNEAETQLEQRGRKKKKGREKDQPTPQEFIQRILDAAIERLRQGDAGDNGDGLDDPLVNFRTEIERARRSLKAAEFDAVREQVLDILTGWSTMANALIDEVQEP